MKSVLFALLTLVVWGVADSSFNKANAFAVVLHCEQGNPNSWKTCEASPEDAGMYIWTVSGGAQLDSGVCTTTSNVCTAICTKGSRSGRLHVSVYDTSGALIGTASRSLGCIT